MKFGGLYPYVVRTSQNNGIRNYITENVKFLNPANTISFGQDTATIFYQDRPYFTGDKIKIMTLKNGELNAVRSCYFLSAMRKAFINFQWGQNSFDEEILANIRILLPATSKKEIAFDYMERVIRELEEERIRELAAYLKVSDLESTELTEGEKSAVQMLRNDEIQWHEFTIGDLFELLSAPYRGEKPRQDHVSRQKNDEFCVPVVCAKRGDNGIMYWGRQGDFVTYGNVLSVIYNGAIAAGLVYAQKEPVGIFTDSYLIRLRENNVPFKVNLFLKTSLEKAIYEKYSRELKAVWKRISKDTMILPVTSLGAINWDFMETLITAEARLAIRGVIEWKDKVIAKTKELVAE